MRGPQVPGLARGRKSQLGAGPQEERPACGQPPHLGAVVVQLEGQRHGPVDVDLLGPVDVLRADLQAGSRALPGKLGSLGVGGGADRSFMGGLGSSSHISQYTQPTARGQRWGTNFPGATGLLPPPPGARWPLPSFHCGCPRHRAVRGHAGYQPGCSHLAMQAGNAAEPLSEPQMPFPPPRGLWRHQPSRDPAGRAPASLTW